MQYTKVDAPLQYVVEYTEPPKRTVKSGHYARPVQLLVPTVFSGEAVLVATVKDTDFRHIDVNKTKEFWFYEGKFYSPVEEEGMFKPGDFFEYDPVILSAWKNGVGRELPDLVKINSIAGQVATSLDQVTTELDKLHHAMQDEIERSALMVDGRLMRRVKLPKLHAEMIHRYRGADVKLHLWQETDRLSENRYFEIMTNLSGFEALKEWAQAIAQYANNDVGIQTDLSRWHEIKVFEPSLLPDEQTFERHVLYLSDSLLNADTLLRQRSDRMIHAWLDARRCHQNAIEDLSVSSIENLLDAWDRWMEIYHDEEIVRCRGFQGHHDPKEDAWQVALNAARVFWDNRPMNEMRSNPAPEHGLK